LDDWPLIGIIFCLS